MTDKDREGYIEKFLELIRKALEKKIFFTPKIKALICRILDCLAGIISDNPKQLLDELEKLINELINEQGITETTGNKQSGGGRK